MKLGEGEYLVARIKKHWISLVFPLIIGILLIGAILPTIWMIYKIARYSMDEITLTNKKFYVKEGLFEKQIEETPLEKINGATYEQSFLGRKLNYGTLYVQVGVNFGGVDYSYIAEPELVKSMIEQAVAATKTTDEQTT